MIEVRKLTKYYGSFRALKEVSFSIKEGERVGLLGPNGAGKSTMMRILTGFMPASYGTATIGEYEIHEYPLEVKRLIGYLPERVPLYDEMTVKSFLKFVAKVKGLSSNQCKVAVDEVVQTCGLEEVYSRVVGVLSKGFRQRLGLAQALIGSPPVIILDEPTVGLDPQQVVEIRDLIKNLGERHTVLLSTHILSEVSLLCSRALILNAGEIVSEITIDPTKPPVEIEQAFLKAIAREGVGIEK